MLVLSRKQNESVKFPNLGISIEVLRVDGKTVRVGIDAPRDVRILRGELADAASGNSATSPTNAAEQHELRNRLNTASLSLAMLQMQIDAGKMADAEETLTKAVEVLASLEEWAGKGGFVSQASPHPNELTPGNPCRALVVDDNANEGQLLAGFLEMCGYDVDIVSDGSAALDYLASHALPDVVLLDMNMPGVDGPQTVTQIRNNSNYRDLKVFAVSGADRATVSVAVGQGGVDRWFSKPLQPSDFAKSLSLEMRDCCRVAS